MTPTLTLLFALLWGGPEVIQPVFVTTGPEPEQTALYLSAFYGNWWASWNRLEPNILGYQIEVGSTWVTQEKQRYAVWYGRIKDRTGALLLEFPAIPIQFCDPNEAGCTMWHNVHSALNAATKCGGLEKKCPGTLEGVAPCED